MKVNKGDVGKLEAEEEEEEVDGRRTLTQLAQDKVGEERIKKEKEEEEKSSWKKVFPLCGKSLH